MPLWRRPIEEMSDMRGSADAVDSFPRAMRVVPSAIVLSVLCVVACSRDDSADSGIASSAAADAPAPNEGATLNVDDGDGVGKLGDDRLSLAEAIALANGERALDVLSASERTHVQGLPGAGRADRIQVHVNEIVLPAPEPTKSALPRLIGNDHDSLDGHGVVLKESGAQAVGTALVAASSGLAIENFVFDNIWRGILIDPQGPVEVHDITVRKNHFLGVAGSAVEISGSRMGSGGSLREISVDENEFMLPTTPTGFSYGVAIRSCQLDSPDDVAAVAEGMLTGVSLDGIYVRKNTIRGGAETIVVNVASIHGKGEITDCALRRLVIDDNVLGGSFDMLVNINVAITYAFTASISSLGMAQNALGPPGSAAALRGIVLEDVEIERNKMDGAQTAALSLYAGIQSISSEDPNLTVVEDIALRKVRIKDNTHANLEGKRTICSGINLVAGHFDYVSGGRSSNNEASDIEITGNSFSGCESGIRVVAAEVIGGGGEARENRISDVKILENKLTDNNVGLQLLAAEGVPPSALFAMLKVDFPNVGTMENNVVERAEVRANEITGNRVGFELIGGRSSSTADTPGDILRNNALEDVTLEGNTILNNDDQDCLAQSDVVVGQAGIAEGNTAPSSCGDTP
jgi:hypothetical protein